MAKGTVAAVSATAGAILAFIATAVSAGLGAVQPLSQGHKERVVIDANCAAPGKRQVVYTYSKNYVIWEIENHCADAKNQPIEIVFENKSGGPGECDPCQATIKDSTAADNHRVVARLRLDVKDHSNVHTGYDFNLYWGTARAHQIDPRLEVDP